jgi:hypothetical protein
MHALFFRFKTIANLENRQVRNEDKWLMPVKGWAPIMMSQEVFEKWGVGFAPPKLQPSVSAGSGP